MKIFKLSGNMLKTIAAICMLIDHIGFILFPENMDLRLIGRISFPIFAFLIAEGCRYTKNRVKYFSVMAIFAVVCHIFYAISTKPIFLNIFFTLAFAILIIYSADNFAKAIVNKRDFKAVLFYAGLTVITISAAYTADRHLLLDYGFWGCMLPLFAFVFPPCKNILCKILSLCLFSLGLYPLIGAIHLPVQEYAYLSLIPLFFYSGKRGKYNMKYFFYIFYPLHLAVIYIIGTVIK